MTTKNIVLLIVSIVCLILVCTIFTFVFKRYFGKTTNYLSSGSYDYSLVNDIFRKSKKASKAKRASCFLGQILSYVVISVLFVFFVISLASKIQGNTIPVGNSTMVVIASGSMSKKNNKIVKNNSELNNQFNTYDIIGITKYSSQDDVKLYDVVAYKNKNNVTIVHRIVEVNNDVNTGMITYLTQGDSNFVDDKAGSQYEGSYLTYDKIIGKYDGRRIKGLGMIVIFLQSYIGAATVVAVIYCMIAFDYFAAKYKKEKIKRLSFINEQLASDDGCKPDAYDDIIVFNNKEVYFSQGKYLGKTIVVDERMKDYMVVVNKTATDNNTVMVADLKNNTNQKFEDVSDAVVTDLVKFVNDNIKTDNSMKD